MKPKSIITTLAFCALASGLQAATLYWDGGASSPNSLSDNATTGGLTWLGSGVTAGNWDDPTTITSAPLAAWAAGDSAVFGGTTATPQTITAGTLTIGNLTFGGGGDGTGTSGTNYTVTGGTLTLSASSTITTNTNATISSALAGTGSALIKAGAATLTLTGTKTYTGGTTVNAGTLTLGTGAATGVIRGALAIGSAAQVNADTNWSFGHTPSTGPNCVSSIAITSGTLNFTGTNENGGTSASGITLTGGTISGSRFDWYNGITNTPTLTTVASASTATISSGFRMRYATTNSLTLNVAQGTTVSGTDLLISGNITTNATNGIIKSGVGTAVMSGTNTYGGTTTVNAGTLVVTGSLSSGVVNVNTNGTFVANGSLTNSAVTVNATATLAGTGTVKSATVSGTVSPGGSAIGTLTVSNAITLNAGGKAVCQIDKTNGESGMLLTNDQLYVTGVTYGGTLEVTATGETLAAGDSFRLFDALNYAGTFSNFTLPALTGSLNWDLSNLGVNGTITVVNYAPTPVFTPVAGGYVGAQSITMNSGAGTTVRYTYSTNGIEPADPTTSSDSGTLDSGSASFAMPTNSSLWIKAMATKPGSSNSPVASAQYHTVSQPTWIEPLGGYWGDDFNWQNSVIGNATGVVADFSTLTLAAPATITNDVNHTIGGLLFGDQGNTNGWMIDGSSILTLAGASPAITVNNQSATITAPLAGTDPVSKAGLGTLILGNPTYTGSTTVIQGSLVLNNPATASGTGTGGFRTSGFTIATGSTLKFDLTTGYRTPNNGMSITGAGTLVKSGSAALYLGGNSVDYASAVSLDSGTLIDIQGGSIELHYAYNKTTWAANKADMHIAAGATFDIWDYGNTGANYVKIDALTGAGTIQRGVTAPTTTGGLEIGVDNGSGSFSGVIQNGVGTSKVNLRKSGTGNQTLAGTNTYTGTTTVNGGTLTLTGSQLLKPTTNGSVNGIGGTASLVLNGTLVLDLATTDTTSGNQWLLVDATNLNESYAGNFGLTNGTDAFAETTPGSGVWTLTSGSNKWTFTKSTGVLGVAPASGFQSWIDSFTSLTNAADKLASADPDNDGIKNIVEFVLNGNPTSGADSNLPQPQVTATDFVFTFTRRVDSATGTVQVFEYGSTLAGWTPVNITGTPGAEVAIGAATGTAPNEVQTVTVTIPKGANTHLFARLAVSQ